MKKKKLTAFLRLFLPLAGCILLGAFFYADSQRATERNRIETSERLNVQLGASMLDRRLLIVIRDLRAMASGSSLSHLLDQASDDEIRRTELDFLGFSRARQAYDQVRLLGLDGQEVVRVDFSNDAPRIVNRSQLQNKADRYYFRETLALPPGQIYISPLDLNIEHKKIEVPYKPMLRVAMPVADSRGEKRGILVLNYRSEEMLGYFREITQAAADHLSIVNNDGYFLHAPNTNDEWGFMLRRPELNLGYRYPQSWARLKDVETDQFEDDRGLWTVATVHPLRIGRENGAGEKDPAPEVNPYHWKIVAHLETRNMPTLYGVLGNTFPALIAALLGLSALFAYILAHNSRRTQAMEERFQAYFEHAVVGMAIYDLDQRWQSPNPAFCNMLGYTPEQLRDKRWEDVTHPDDLELSKAAYDKVIRGETDGYELEKRYLRADGRIIDVAIAVRAVRGSNGEVEYMLGTFEDITTRVSAEKALRASEERLRTLGDNLPESYVYQCTIDAQGKMEFTYISSGTREIHGYEPDEILKDANLLFREVDPEQLPYLQGTIAESQQTLGDFAVVLRVHMVNVQWGWLQLRSRPRRTATGQIVWDGVATDITARHETMLLIDKQARRSAIMLELPKLAGNLDEKAFMQNVIGQIEQITDSRIGFMHFINDDQESIELAAWSANTVAHYCTASFDLHYPLSAAGLWADAARQKRPIIVNDYAKAEHKQGLPEGHATLSRLVSVPVIDGDYVRLMVGVGNKGSHYTEADVETIQLLANETWRILRQKRAEQALRIAMQVVNASPVVCFRRRATDGWPVAFVSDNVSAWGYSVDGLLAGHPPFAEIVHPDDLPRVAEEVSRYSAEGRDEYVQEYRLLTAEKQVLWVVDRSKVLRAADGRVEFYDGVLTDITERQRQEQELAANLAAQRTLNKRLEEAHNQLLQSEKMASIGQLAAGIAHELNNPIGFVHSNLGTLESYLRDLMEIIDASDRLGGDGNAQACIAQLKEERDFAFMRDDIVQLLAESKEGLNRVRKIVLDLKSFSHVSEQEWQWANLHQGLDSTLNIVWNELKYKCKVIKEYGELPEVYCLISQLNQVFMNILVNAGHAIETQGTITLRTRPHGPDQVCIEISDTGKGIAPEHLTRIFEPFFTTKPVGKGTGLGLSLSYGIVDKHHGRIEVDSQVGSGTTFRIILPIQPDTGTPPDQATETPQ